MSAGEIASIVTAAASPVITILSVVIANSKNRAITDFKIDQLSSEVRKHNSLIDRMYKVEEKLRVCEVELQNVEKQLEK